MINYTERSKASKKGKASQFPYHLVKIENGEEPVILHSYKTLKTAEREREKANDRAASFCAHEGIAQFYHYEIVAD